MSCPGSVAFCATCWAEIAKNDTRRCGVREGGALKDGRNAPPDGARLPIRALPDRARPGAALPRRVPGGRESVPSALRGARPRSRVAVPARADVLAGAVPLPPRL